VAGVVSRSRLRSRSDRFPPRCHRCGRRLAHQLETRLAAARPAAPPRRRSSAARGHPRPPLRDRLGYRRSPAPRRSPRTARSCRQRSARRFLTGPRACPSPPATGRAQALPQPPPPRLAPQWRPIGAGPARPRRLPHWPSSSAPLSAYQPTSSGREGTSVSSSASATGPTTPTAWASCAAFRKFPMTSRRFTSNARRSRSFRATASRSCSFA
jgi:hypothetical protein